ncbi:MAG: LysM peptidoglycan-binding domain-containing protein [Proteobacteria bacterium]|nr:LysM peptidoglycan-binding domain-containing protein [Pseudomonadota bacterium]
MDGRLGRLEQSVKDIQTRMAQMEKNSALLLAGQKDLSEKINQLGRIASTMPAPAAPKPAPAPAPAPAVSAPKPAPAPNPVATAAPKPAASLTYTVRPGDTLYSIAKKHGLTVDQLKRLNGLKGDSLGVGQELKLK